MMRLGAPATLIQYNSMNFAITYMPDKICTRQYIKDLQQYDTRKLLNVCGSSYNPEWFTVVGITVEDLYFPDGTFPDSDTIDEWLLIVRHHFIMYPQSTLAVHDESGLGRAAVLVAIALMETGMKAAEAIDLIRMKRRGAFNDFQLEELTKYKSKQRLLEREKSKMFGNLYGKRHSGSGSGSGSGSSSGSSSATCSDDRIVN